MGRLRRGPRGRNLLAARSANAGQEVEGEADRSSTLLIQAIRFRTERLVHDRQANLATKMSFVRAGEKSSDASAVGIADRLRDDDVATSIVALVDAVHANEAVRAPQTLQSLHTASSAEPHLAVVPRRRQSAEGTNATERKLTTELSTNLEGRRRIGASHVGLAILVNGVVLLPNAAAADEAFEVETLRAQSTNLVVDEREGCIGSVRRGLCRGSLFRDLVLTSRGTLGFGREVSAVLREQFRVSLERAIERVSRSLSLDRRSLRLVSCSLCRNRRLLSIARRGTHHVEISRRSLGTLGRSRGSRRGRRGRSRRARSGSRSRGRSLGLCLGRCVVTHRRSRLLAAERATSFEIQLVQVPRIVILDDRVAPAAGQPGELVVLVGSESAIGVVDVAVAGALACVDVQLPLRHTLVVVVVDAEALELREQLCVLDVVAAITVLVHPVVRDVEDAGLDRRIGVVAVSLGLLTGLQHTPMRDAWERVLVLVGAERRGGRSGGRSRGGRDRARGTDQQRQCAAEEKTLLHGNSCYRLSQPVMGTLCPLGV